MNHTTRRLLYIPSRVIVIAAIVTSYTTALAIIITIIVYVNTCGSKRTYLNVYKSDLIISLSSPYFAIIDSTTCLK